MDCQLPAVPVGLTLAHVRTPPEPARLLETGSVLAFRFTAEPPDTQHHATARWHGEVEVCTPHPTGAPTWSIGWAQMRRLGIPGLGDAIAALTQPVPLSEYALGQIWGRRAYTYEGWGIWLTLARDAQWVGLENPQYALSEHYDRLAKAFDRGPADLVDACAQDPLPGRAIVDLLVRGPASASAHAQLELAHVCARATATVAQICPDITATGWARLPLAPPTARALQHALQNPQ